jgi:hypothetical protein
MTFQANFERVRQSHFLGLIFLPQIFCGEMSIGGRLVQRVFLPAKAAVDFSYNFPIKSCESGFDEARHEGELNEPQIFLNRP